MTMKEEQIDYLLKKFYDGETSQEEENQLKDEFMNIGQDSPEKDYFIYTKSQSSIPDDLENNVYEFLTQKLENRKTIRRRIYSIVSFAAVLVVIFSIFNDIRKAKSQKMEDKFFMMEQALFQVSESLKPEKQEDMMVLWVDNNVEIIVK